MHPDHLHYDSRRLSVEEQRTEGQAWAAQMYRSERDTWLAREGVLDQLTGPDGAHAATEHGQEDADAQMSVPANSPERRRRVLIGMAACIGFAGLCLLVVELWAVR